MFSKGCNCGKLYVLFKISNMLLERRFLRNNNRKTIQENSVQFVVTCFVRKVMLIRHYSIMEYFFILLHFASLTILPTKHSIHVLNTILYRMFSFAFPEYYTTNRLKWKSYIMHSMSEPRLTLKRIHQYTWRTSILDYTYKISNSLFC